MNEIALKESLEFVLEIGYITADTRENMMKYVYEGAPFDIFDDKSKKELTSFYEIIKKDYMERTGEFLPNIFYVEEK